MSRRRGRGDAGETLVELLISFMIIGISVTAVLGGLRLAVSSSTLDQRQVHAQALLRSWGEHVVAVRDNANVGQCPAASGFSYTAPPVGLEALPTGFHADISTAKSWDATSGSFVSCVAGSSVQRLTLQMTVDDALYPGFVSTYDVVVRRPCAATGVC